jgi:transcriptional regulator with XRE-family HTH domain
MRNIESQTGFSENLLFFRKKRGLTQDGLAKLSGVSRRMLAYYETHKANPTVDVIASIAKALNVSIEDLIGKVEIKTTLDEVLNVDARTLKKLKQLLSLKKNDRLKVYEYMDMLIAKRMKKAS